MRVLVIVFFSLLVAAPAAAGPADWQQAFDELLSAAPDAQGALLAEVERAEPVWTDVVARIQAMSFPDASERGTAVLRTTVCEDGVERPWVIVIPADYDPGMPTPLLVVLHGGVSRTTIEEDPLAYVGEDEFGSLIRDRGWLALYPFGQVGATWWDEVGMANIRGLVRTVKREYNVDDDRVWMAGFSDGASAGFLHAMVAPDDYAAFVALNGHMGVGSLDGDLPLYAPNFSNTPVYAVTTFGDQLYPSARMRPTIAMAREAGGDIFYRELEGEHEFSYAGDELPRIGRFLERHPRDPFPSGIVWETAGPEFGRCRWFAIDRVTTDEPKAWHADHNAALVDEAVTIGFQPDDAFEGIGVRVASLAEGDYPAAAMGLEAGDIIVAGGGEPIATMDDLGAFKAGLKRGDTFELTVLRGEGKVTLDGKMPEPANYLLFKRDVPSGLARASCSANTIDVETSRVGAFRVFVHPDMVRLDRNLVIRANGETVFDGRVAPDVGFLLKNFLANRDRKLLYVAEIRVSLE
jgi:poly(3-hydroxybutyrate) depolymerase